MRKIYTTIAMALIVAGYANSQTITGRFDLGYPNNVALSMPKEFSYDKTPLIFLYDNTDFIYDKAGETNLLLYDENLDLKKTIHLIGDKIFDYQLTYQDKTREVLSVNEAGKTSYIKYGSYEEFCRNEFGMDPNIQPIITEQENGDKKITFDYERNHWTSNERMYYCYPDFGMKYPKVYYILSHEDGSITYCETNYTIRYSDWKDSGTHVEEKQVILGRIRLCNINLNQGDGKNDLFFEVSQTLFNDDEKFEYLIPKYKLSSKGNTLSDNNGVIIGPGYGETITTTQSTVVSEDKYLALTGFQVVSENGDIIKDLNFDSDFEGRIDDEYAFVITIGNNTYLAFDGSSDDKDATIFYKIDRTTTDIKQVMKAPATMRVSPSITNRNTPINISLGDDNLSGSEIVVVSANGAKVKSQSIPAGQKSAQLFVPYSTGVYCVSRIQNNKVTDSRKIIIK